MLLMMLLVGVHNTLKIDEIRKDSVMGFLNNTLMIRFYYMHCFGTGVTTIELQ